MNHDPVCLSIGLVTLGLVACAQAPPLPVHGTHLEPNLDQTTIIERNLSFDDVHARLWPSREDQQFRPSTLLERQAVFDILSSLFQGVRGGAFDAKAIAAKASGVGLRLESWHVAGRAFWVLVEKEDQRRGAGSYVIRSNDLPAQEVEIILQAPHAYYDLRTDDIAASLFFDGDFELRALFTNTAHRYWNESGNFQKREHSPADLCHRSDHVFQQATSAAARVLDHVTVIQLHGFGDSSHRPQAIISSGDLSGSRPMVRALTQTLSSVIDDVRRFPEDFDELGGTTNAQGRLLANFPHTHFVHVELSASTRKQLRASPELLARFGSALFGNARSVGPDERPSSQSGGQASGQAAMQPGGQPDGKSGGLSEE